MLATFHEALATGDLQRLLDVMAPDVVLLSDGGGVKQAALRPIVGAEKVLRWFVGVAGRAPGPVAAEEVLVNGAPGLRLTTAGELDTVATLRVEGGRVTALYLVRNPHKLGHVATETPLAR